MRTCSFCGEEIPEGTGKMYVRRDGSISFFCSSTINLEEFQGKLSGLNNETKNIYHVKTRCS